MGRRAIRLRLANGDDVDLTKIKGKQRKTELDIVEKRKRERERERERAIGLKVVMIDNSFFSLSLHPCCCCCCYCCCLYTSVCPPSNQRIHSCLSSPGYCCCCRHRVPTRHVSSRSRAQPEWVGELRLCGVRFGVVRGSQHGGCHRRDRHGCLVETYLGARACTKSEKQRVNVDRQAGIRSFKPLVLALTCILHKHS